MYRSLVLSLSELQIVPNHGFVEEIDSRLIVYCFSDIMTYIFQQDVRILDVDRRFVINFT